MKWLCCILPWLAFLVAITGCAPDLPPPAVAVIKPTPEYLCHPEIYGFPGCECPPYCVFRDSTNVQFVVTFLHDPPHDADGNPVIIPLLTGHSYKGLLEPKPLRTDTGKEWDSTLAFTIEVDTNGVPAPSVQLHLSIDAADDSGNGAAASFGHYHGSNSVRKPTGFLSDSLPMTPATSPYRDTVTYTPSQYSEPVTLTISSSAAKDTLRKAWTVGVDSLVHMSGPYVTLVGEIAPHPHSHYVRPGTMDALNALAAKWRAVYGTNLELNDMSLQHGGKFDLNLDWRVDTAMVGKCLPHCEHRLGRSADINGLSPSDTVPYHLVVKWWHDLGARLNEFPESGKAHLRDTRQP